MSDDILLVSRDERGVATVTMNRPEVHNAFDDVLIGRITKAFEDLGADDSVRVVVLASKGPSFSAGADLNWMKRMAGYTRDQNVEDALGLAAMCRAIDTCPKPTIALVQGAAFGGGVGLVACCDIAIGTTHAKFMLSEVKLGLIPAVISPYVVRAMGARAARRYFLTAERIEAADAQRLGLLHEVVEDEEDLASAGDRMVATLLANGPAAIAAAKALVDAVAERPIDAPVIQDTAERIADTRASAEGREGVTAFLEKRKPAWVQGQG
ncbi:enoyl-CoA hydratase/isomerase family protein [Caenispirillum bisanense]|uniref:Methylglutaconyl-CoA hydratase n=1 Tax=Caenispirillum bisanense TaxID=414052 RepID=A0A286GLL0_9PROT|nr:enoyl-CoA hydratase/isomerase family protein [Caenispirillum bisanense]SOD96427.1 methylglutaconyl-CoA hydratase [Caenispirillum bisanense]